MPQCGMLSWVLSVRGNEHVSFVLGLCLVTYGLCSASGFSAATLLPRCSAVQLPVLPGAAAPRDAVHLLHCT